MLSKLKFVVFVVAQWHEMLVIRNPVFKIDDAIWNRTPNLSSDSAAPSVATD
jgi:hypothetical protein